MGVKSLGLVSAPLYVTLLHYPMTNRDGALITTAVTNMDIHDLSRTARTYGARGLFLVTPIEEQHQLVGRILGHWTKESSRIWHPDRVEAVSRVRLVHTFDEVKQAIRQETGEDPEVVLPDARPLPNAVGYSQYREELTAPGRTRPAVLVLGTGWGVAATFYPEVHRFLAPVYGPEGREGYNHLSVRAAGAAILDRLLGDR